MMSTVVSFRAGRLVAAWMYSRSNPSSSNSRSGEDDGVAQDGGEEPNISRGSAQYSIQLLHTATLAMVVSIIVGYTVYDNGFYEQLLLVVLIAPFGALGRWKLSRWNNSPVLMGRRPPLPWMPWGTFLANTIGCLVSILCTGVLDRYSTKLLDNQYKWTKLFLVAVRDRKSVV